MKEADNDNEPNPWSSIGLQAAMILNRLRLQAQLTDTNEKKNGEGDDGANRHESNEERARNHREAVDYGLKRLAEFERRASGLTKNRARRK